MKNKLKKIAFWKLQFLNSEGRLLKSLDELCVVCLFVCLFARVFVCLFVFRVGLFISLSIT